MSVVEKAYGFIVKKPEHQQPLNIIDLYPDIRRLHETGALKGKHVAIILDGNSRWAQEHALSTFEGHKAGAETGKILMRACRDLGMDVSLWILSPNNITKRSREETEGIFKILDDSIGELVKEAEKSKGRIIHVGEMAGLPLKIKLDLWRAQRRTKNNTGNKVILAINYSQDMQMKSLAEKVRKKKRETNFRSSETVRSMMYGNGEIRPADVLIRTGKVQRLSGFGPPFVGDETELFFPNLFLPDFTLEQFKDVLIEYSNRLQTQTLGGRTNGHEIASNKTRRNLIPFLRR
jgi:undecaprenyl diphosphate synthase